MGTSFSVESFRVWLAKFQRSLLPWILKLKGEECLWKSPAVIDIIHKDTSHSGYRITNTDRIVTTGKWSFSIEIGLYLEAQDFMCLPIYLLSLVIVYHL